MKPNHETSWNRRLAGLTGFLVSASVSLPALAGSETPAPSNTANGG